MLIGPDGGGEPALVTDAHGKVSGQGFGSKGMGDLGPPVQGLTKAPGPIGDLPAFLKIGPLPMGMDAAIEHIETRDREPGWAGPSPVGIHRQIGRVRGRFGAGHRHAENRIGPQAAFVVGSIRSDYCVVYGFPVPGVRILEIRP